MAGKKLSLDPDVVLEWLLDRRFIEPTESAIHPYRIAINEDDFLPFTITFLTNELSKAFSKQQHGSKSKMKIRCTNKKSWRRELYRCLDEYQVSFDDRSTRANAHWDFELTTKRFLEQKLCIDMDALHEYDRQHRSKGKGGMRYSSYFNQAKGRYGVDRALEKF